MSENITTSSKPKWVKWAVTGGIAVVILGIILSFVGTIDSLRNTRIEKENSLVAQYKTNQNELSTYILTFKETLGVAVEANDKLEEILLEAVKGRYGDDANGVDPTGGTMFSAIAEAYPDLTANADLYSQVQKIVVEGRDKYKNQQNKLMDMVNNYLTWRESGLIDHLIIDAIGYSDNFKVTFEGEVVKGDAALDAINRVILVQDAIDAYDGGTVEPLIGDEE